MTLEAVAALFGASEDAVAVGESPEDGPAVVLWANAAFARLSGLPAEALAGRVRLLEVAGVDPAVGRALDDALADGRSTRAEVFGRRPDGAGYWADVTVTPLPGPGRRFMALARDVTERRRVEERLEFALAGANDGLWDWNIVRGETFFSPRYQAMLGFEPGTMPSTYEAWRSRIHPLDWPLVKAALDAHLEGRSPEYEVEHRLRGADEAWRWILARGKVVARDAEGRPLRMVGTHTDVSARKAAEQAVKRTAERLKGVLEGTFDNIYAVDRDWRLTYLNRNAMAAIGGGRDLVGTNLWEAFPEAVGTTIWTEFRRAVADRVPVAFETYYQPFDAWYEATAFPSSEGLSVFFRDVTDRRRAADALRAAKEQAEKASRSKSDFLALVSHELRTPLNAIIGFSESLSLEIFGPMTPKQREYADDINAAGRHLLALVGDMLDLSRVDAGRLSLRLEPTELAPTLRACLAVTGPEAERSRIALEAEIAPELPTVLGDAVRLRQILLNLLGNAVKYTPEGGTVRVAAGRAADGSAEIAIADSGIGMRPEDIPTALEPFRQLDSPLARRHEGAGLGLPLAKRLVELHGGTLAIDSAPGRGTIVTIRLPAAAAQEGSGSAGLEAAIG
ncbi:MAG TPA: ATP-binding protein [Alphaproteobacteria bacterium]|nr:ATP-binding protein [Alphaproteobacteria bacterium]